MPNTNSLFLNFEKTSENSGVYHLHVEPRNPRNPVHYLCGQEPESALSLRRVRSSELLGFNNIVRPNILCEDCKSKI